MANKMLIDTTHPEETRVVVLRGNRVEEFDFESANRRQLRGNIYLAKVTRVEPSLQAAFVDYGGNRHGFLAFSEIHPDYYQIPVADRQALIAEEERAHRDAEDEIDRRASGGGGRGRRPRREHSRRDPVRTQPLEESAAGEHDSAPAEIAGNEGATPVTDDSGTADHPDTHQADAHDADAAHDAHSENIEPAYEAEAQPAAEQAAAPSHEAPEHHEETSGAGTSHDTAAELTSAPDESTPAAESPDLAPEAPHNDEISGGGNIVEIEEPAAAENGEDEVVESVGGADAMEEVQDRAPRYRRNYKIQEVIKRRQIMLVQVVKEERGTKGAALTTYLSLAGRYSVLMPNTARGGGISRKITNALDRKKLKEIAQDLEVPEGMGVILRTAGASRTKTEVKRDFEYLLRLWETVRDFTLKSTAPTLVYEEGSLIKRSIRDLYNKDIEEILVAGETGHREARDFMRMLMPSHAKNVKLYHEAQPIFTRYGIESQLDAMFSSTVQLRSGGYIVLNQTEALVAIDVNSGRATREHHIEDTALKTNLEASEEVARQLRLRDLAGLIVIDFIDMDEGRNNRLVERRLKESLKNDRARIQVGRISHFGLMEMSRQRIRSSVLESSTDKCPHCGGTGHVRSVSSVALHLLRMLEEMLIKGATHSLIVRTRSEVALYVLNHKRAHLREFESRFQITITVNADATMGAAQPFLIEKGEQVHSPEAAKAIAAQAPVAPAVEYADDDIADEVDEEEVPEQAEGAVEAEAAGEDSSGTEPEARDGEPRERGRRRRRGRGGREGREGGREPRESGPQPREGGFAHESTSEHASAHEGNGGDAVETVDGEAAERGPSGAPGQNGDAEHRRRRRGRRGGRRNRRGREGEGGFAGANGGNEEHQEHGQGVEPEVADAVADLGGASPAEAPSAPEPQAPQPFEPVAREAPRDVAPEPVPQEQPRRRSTIREPAPVFSSGPMSDVQPTPAPAPPPALPEPVVTTPEPAAASSEAQAKRRFGWWNKRS
jgi:ribonuclease E